MNLKFYLFYGVGVGETPASVHVCCADRVASITATTLRLQATIARAAIGVGLYFIHLVNVVSQLGAVRVRNHDAVFINPDFEYVVRNVTLQLPTDVHNIEAEYFKHLSPADTFFFLLTPRTHSNTVLLGT